MKTPLIICIFTLLFSLPCAADGLTLHQRENEIRSKPELMQTFREMGYHSALEAALAFEEAEQVLAEFSENAGHAPHPLRGKTAICAKGGYSILIGVQGAICATLEDAYQVLVISPGLGVALGLNAIFFRSSYLESGAFYRGAQLGVTYGYGAELGYFSEYRCPGHSTEMEDALNCRNSIPKDLRGELIIFGAKLGIEGTLGFSAKVTHLRSFWK